MVVPILSHGCEIWNAYTKHCFESWEKSSIEKVHLRYCKYYLGVNNKATNIACRAELGRFPLKLLVNFRKLKYITRMVELQENSQAKQAFKISAMLSNKVKPSFHSKIKQILDLYRINYTDNLQTMTTNDACKYQKITETYIQF